MKHLFSFAWAALLLLTAFPALSQRPGGALPPVAGKGGPVAAYSCAEPVSGGQHRFDTVAHVVSGTFEAKLREYQGPDSLTITQGRFDCTF